ncbi:MAG: hypothetical protein JO166_11095 [Deltaproteobacteria bacterium]|nr:hypothetical protein [Deltaproteobacteria bacterium]
MGVLLTKSELNGTDKVGMKSGVHPASRRALIGKPRRGRTERTLARFYRAIDEIAALNRPLGRDEIAERLGYTRKTYEQAITPRLRLIPWLKINPDHRGIRFEIDHELREICFARQPRPSLGGFSIGAFLRETRAEISRRKKEEQDERAKAQWTSERVRFKFAFELVEWIEGELDRVLSSCLS